MPRQWRVTSRREARWRPCRTAAVAIWRRGFPGARRQSGGSHRARTSQLVAVREAEGGRTVSVATVATVRARTASPYSPRERVCVFCCRCDASVKYRVAVVVLVAPCVKKQAAAGGPLVSCSLRERVRVVIGAERGTPWRKRGGETVASERASERRVSPREVGLRRGADGGPNWRGLRRSTHTVVRCPRARRDSRRENNGVDLRAALRKRERRRESER